jgi:hypothetical protein
MSEEKKPDETVSPEDLKKGVWKHDQELSFNRVNEHLQTLLEATQKAVEFERAKLAKMVGAKDLVRKPKA